MSLTLLNSLLLIVSLSLLIAQLLVKQKRAVHILFAIFCGSVAMVAAKQLGNGEWGLMGYAIAIGTCATCNVYWLVARALFRPSPSITIVHISAAVGLGALLVIGQLMGLAQDAMTAPSVLLVQGRTALYNVINLLSSCMLVMAAWEGCRGLSSLSVIERRQRLVYLSSYCGAVLLCTVAVNFVDGPQMRTALDQWLSASCALLILLTTQGLIIWRFHRSAEPNSAESSIQSNATDIDHATVYLANQIQQVVDQQQLYLQANLKVADIARMMNESEYRVSRAIREHLCQPNFNQYINAKRIEHAKQLLADPKCDHWSILVISLESGFASVGPFSRTFKQITALTPNQYRQQKRHQSHQLDQALNGMVKQN